MEFFSLYDETKGLGSQAEVDTRRLILYDYPPTLNQNGIYNILEAIDCPPTNIILMDGKKKDSASDVQGKDEQRRMSYVVSSKTPGSWAIVEFGSKAHVDKAFYLITSKHKKYMDAQYAYASH